jgi:hypothetical protein
MEGAELTCRVYQKNSTENTLLDEFTWTDPNPIATGVSGLLVANDEFPDSLETATALFDNFFATDGQLPAPVITRPTVVGENFQFAFTAEAGHPYRVDYKPEADGAIWTALTELSPEPATRARTVQDPLTPDRRYYRVEALFPDL